MNSAAAWALSLYVFTGLILGAGVIIFAPNIGAFGERYFPRRSKGRVLDSLWARLHLDVPYTHPNHIRYFRFVGAAMAALVIAQAIGIIARR